MSVRSFVTDRSLLQSFVSGLLVLLIGGMGSCIYTLHQQDQLDKMHRAQFEATITQELKDLKVDLEDVKRAMPVREQAHLSRPPFGKDSETPVLATIVPVAPGVAADQSVTPVPASQVPESVSPAKAVPVPPESKPMPVSPKQDSSTTKTKAKHPHWHNFVEGLKQ